jgi:hypothetical protein
MGQTVAMSPKRVLKLLTQQRDLYRQLEDLGHRQRTLISGDRPELLLDLLTHRQKLISELTVLNEHLAPVRQEWDAFYRELPDDLRGRVSDALGEISRALHVILESDRQDEALLSARKQSLSQVSERFVDGAAANAAYAAGEGAAGLSERADLVV